MIAIIESSFLPLLPFSFPGNDYNSAIKVPPMHDHSRDNTFVFENYCLTCNIYLDKIKLKGFNSGIIYG